MNSFDTEQQYYKTDPTKTLLGYYEKEVHKKICDCNVTITFKGHNPDIKDLILNLLCDSFEDRVKQETMQEAEHQ